MDAGSVPSRSQYSGTTSQPSWRYSATAVGPPAPLPASTTTLRAARARAASSRRRARRGTGRSRRASASACARCGAGVAEQRGDLVAQRGDRRAVERSLPIMILKPLSSGGLWLPVIITAAAGARSCAAKYSTGVGTTPMSTTSAWTRMPSVSAANKPRRVSRQSRPTTTTEPRRRELRRSRVPIARATCVVEIAVGDAADVVLAEDARVHARPTLPRRGAGRAPEQALLARLGRGADRDDHRRDEVRVDAAADVNGDRAAERAQRSGAAADLEQQRDRGQQRDGRGGDEAPPRLSAVGAGG